MQEIDLGGTIYPARDLKDVPWVRYRVVTAHGSHLCVYFQADIEILSNEDRETVILRAGYTRVIGYSVSMGQDIDIGGQGFTPQPGGHVAVGTDGTYSNGLDRIREELIKTIQSTEEVGISPPE